MVASPWQCSWEAFSGGSKAHIYGMYPGYFLSTYVLGVRRDAPAADKSITIEPHLGALNAAEGVVATPFGPVQVSWKREGTTLNFSLEVPPGVNATLLLPFEAGKESVTLDAKIIPISTTAKRPTLKLSDGRHHGSY